MTKNILLLTLFVFITSTSLWAQDKGPRSGYKFQTVADLKTTPVKDQQSVGTCWDYATISFLESELLRMGKPEYNLAEIFVAKNAYYEKGVRYIQFHGSNNFSEGGQAHDVIAMIKKYGIVPIVTGVDNIAFRFQILHNDTVQIFLIFHNQQPHHISYLNILSCKCVTDPIHDIILKKNKKVHMESFF